jgi:hypothetical protein
MMRRAGIIATVVYGVGLLLLAFGIGMSPAGGFHAFIGIVGAGVIVWSWVYAMVS